MQYTYRTKEMAQEKQRSLKRQGKKSSIHTNKRKYGNTYTVKFQP